jgi:ATP-dependent protease HslVU (ClpYQ) peptidase subunit
MAADRKVVDGDTNYHTRKICRIGQSLVGAAGDNSAIVKFFRWLEKHGRGKQPTFTEEEDFEGMVLTPSGLFVYDKSCQPDEVVDSFYAIGSGKQAALAAMHMGASPTQAVEIACLVDNSSGGPVDTLSIGA